MTDAVRAFLAITIDDDDIISRISHIQQRLDKQYAKMKLVEPENIHFTMRFLGDTPISKIDTIREHLQKLSFESFSIDIGHVGAFPNTKRPRVVWIGVETNGDLVTAIKKEVDALMNPLGYKPETRKFTPHATIARVRHVRDLQGIEGNLHDLAHEQAGSMTVSSIKMMKSQLTPSGPIYTELWAIPSS
jgi:2'-5' RNA ligase